MKRVVSIIIFFIFLFVYSKWGPSIPISVLTQSKGEPMIVSDTGKVTVVPDIAKVTIGIEEQGQTLKQVQSAVNAKSKTLTDSLKKLGIDEKDIKTTNYNVYPEYNYESTPYKINGYRVSTNYEVKIIDFGIVNEVLTMATQSGAVVIGNISFEVNEKTKLEYTNKAREEAVKLAKNKAEGLAKAAGVTLGKIINVTESQGVDYPRPMMALEKANITPGETEIQVTVTLSYSL
ncbi:MAG: SIMPL domain-containing protein [Candidatus Woesebacteria bacterium]|nr:SIMPL domain-containing protein [Candidatus Woesebacteria bacterium]